MSTKVAVVIPNHKDELNELEKISLAQCRKILGKYPLIHAVPEGKIFSYFESGDMVAHFPAEYFQSTRTYSLLLLTSQFYETFFDFDYILIYQLDAFVFYDALKEFCSLGYDYIGAPWPRYVWLGPREPKTPRVGNGGFSLRKVKACQKLVIELVAMPDVKKILNRFGEDIFFQSVARVKNLTFSLRPSVRQNFLQWNISLCDT